MEKEELSKILADHVLWFGGRIEGARADLRYADLRYADLRYADLRYADLRGADLKDTDLRGADLKDTDLRGADLRGADLRYADLRHADLRGADLKDTDLRGAKNGEEELLKCNTVLGLTWNILMFQNDVTVGCKKYKVDEWRNFSSIEIESMDKKNALNFYPVLMSVLEYEYKDTKWGV